jgi:hypothetical protein
MSDGVLTRRLKGLVGKESGQGGGRLMGVVGGPLLCSGLSRRGKLVLFSFCSILEMLCKSWVE